MEPITITATELRIKTRDLMERVRFNGECFIVENFRRPVAVIISFEDFVRVKKVLGRSQPALPVTSRHNVDPARRKKKLPASPQT